MDALTRQEWKTKRYLDKQFLNQWKAVRTKIRRCKSLKKFKAPLIEDLRNCNNVEIMSYLIKAPFSTIEEYLKQINTWLELESICYEYRDQLRYTATNFKELTETISKQHRYLELKERIYPKDK